MSENDIIIIIIYEKNVEKKNKHTIYKSFHNDLNNKRFESDFFSEFLN